MTDNSAEREAEKILQDAARKIQTEQCPQGEECAVHHRVNEEYTLESAQYARFITYLGDYVVVTEDNHVLESPTFLIKAVMGLITTENVPDKWETSIFYVGDGPIGDLQGLPREEQGKALRYAKTHNIWGEVAAQHLAVVTLLEQGLIDVSKPFKLED